MILMEISWKTSIEMYENKELNWLQNILAEPNVKTTGDDTYEDFVKLLKYAEITLVIR